MKKPTDLASAGKSGSPVVGEALARPRVWMEALEPRQMLTATMATIKLDRHFGHHGYAEARLPWHDGRAIFMDALAAAPGGKIYAGATQDTPALPTSNQIILARFNADGSPDRTFADRGVLITTVGDGGVIINSLHVQNDGKLLVVTSDYYGGSIALLRFNRDGTPDPGFGTGGRVFTTEPAVLPRGNTNGIGFYSYGPSSWLEHNGRIMLMHQRDDGLVVQRLNTNGTADESFGPGGARLLPGLPNVNPRDPWLHQSGNYSGGIGAIGIPRNGKGAVYYVIDFYPSSSDVGGSSQLIQVNLDGNWKVTSTRKLLQTSLDPSGPEDPYLLWQPDRHLLVALNGKMARLGVDGRPDAAFGVKPFDAAPSYDNVIRVLPDGKILVVRDAYRGWSGVQRLNADGTPDRTFAGGEMAFGFAIGVYFADDPLVLADHSIILGSTFDGVGFGDTGMLQLIKLRPDGGTPNTFDLKAHGIEPFVIPAPPNNDLFTTPEPIRGFGLIPYGRNPFAPGAHGLLGHNGQNNPLEELLQ